MKNDLDAILERVQKVNAVTHHGECTYLAHFSEMTIITSYQHDGGYLPGYEDLVSQYDLTILYPDRKKAYSCLWGHGLIGGDRRVEEIYTCLKEKSDSDDEKRRVKNDGVGTNG
ncbi:hypothetical protein HY639_01670 [Candidatus Woesearchaeota archaeon]|nr:hypothetical protein [Candidatus Woesearchaeota archaeon]